MKVLVAFAPPLIWLLYFREREGFSTPSGVVWRAVLLGAAMTVPAAFVQDLLNRSPELSFQWFYDLALIKALTVDGYNPRHTVVDFIFGGVLEESLKLLAALVVFRCSKASLRPANLPIVVLAIGCGFGIVENAVRYLATADWQHFAVVRSLSGGHVFNGAIMGSLLALGFMRCAPFVSYPAALIVPVLLHGAYNHAISISLIPFHDGSAARLMFFAVVAISAVMAVGLTRLVSRAVVNDRASHPWLDHRRIQKWTWRAFALSSALFGLLLIILSGVWDSESLRLETLLGVFALSYAVLFAWRGRAAAKADASYISKAERLA